MIVKCRITKDDDKYYQLLSMGKEHSYSYIGSSCLWIYDEKIDGDIIDVWLVDLNKISVWDSNWYIRDCILDSDVYKQFKRQLKLERIVR